MRIILIIPLIICFISSFAQKYKWETIVPGISCTGITSDCYVTDILYDSVYNQLYVCGSFDSMAHIYGMARYDGGSWKDMWGIPMQGRIMTRYKDKVIVYAKTGNFMEIYAFDNTGVNDIGLPNGGIGAMEVYNGELYVGGDFSKIDNKKFNNIARWNGTDWNDVGGGVTGLPSLVGALKVFNNKLYVGGGFDTAGNVATWNIAVWNGSAWENAGGAGTYWTINTIYAPVFCFGIYKGYLYMAGNFDYVNGIKTDYLARSSDGKNWQSANYPSGAVSCMKQWGNDFFIGQAGNPWLYKYDGTNYTIPTDTLFGSVFSLEVFNDELYVGGQFYYAGDSPLFKIGKLVKDTSTSVTEIKRKEGTLKIYPNPTDGSFTLLLENNLKEDNSYDLRVTDLIGKVYLRKEGIINANNSVTVPVTLDLPQGIYLISARIGNQYYSSKFIVMP